MKTILPLFLLIIPGSAIAQNWTPAEMEVIQFIDNCQSMWVTADFDDWFDECWDENIIYVDPTVEPTSSVNRDFGRQMRPISRQGVKAIYHRMSTISVKAYGNTAVIHYFGEYISEKNDGEINTLWKGISSETVIKRDGEWKVINKNDWPYPTNQSN